MRSSLFFLVLTIVCISCKHKPPVYDAERCILDSIILDSLVNESELLNMTLLDSQTIQSFDRTTGRLNYYSRKNSSKHFLLDSCKALNMDNFFIEVSFIDDSTLLLVDRGKDENFLYDLHRQKAVPFPPLKPLGKLGTDYILAASKDLPVYFLNKERNSLLLSVYPKLPQYWDDYYQEKFVHNLRVEGDSLNFMQDYFTIPSTTRNGLRLGGSYKLIGDTLYSLFVYVDSLYRYDRAKGAYHVEPIGNFDFHSLPEPWHVQNFGNQKKTTEYALNSFEYIFLTQDFLHKDNLLLFYHTPVERTIASNPTYEDQKRKLLVRSAVGENSYFIFNTHYYHPSCALTYKNQFYALPIFDKYKRDGKKVFHMFDFNNCASKL